MLDPTNVEKHSLQSTSTKESFMSVSSSVTASMFHNYEDSSNSSIWHSKSQLDKQVDIITLDSDDDIIEANIKTYKHELTENINYFNIKNIN